MRALLLFPETTYTRRECGRAWDVPEHPEHQTGVPSEGLPETTLRPAPADFSRRVYWLPATPLYCSALPVPGKRVTQCLQECFGLIQQGQVVTVVRWHGPELLADG